MREYCALVGAVEILATCQSLTEVSIFYISREMYQLTNFIFAVAEYIDNMAAKKKNRTAETEHNPSPTPAVTESEMNVLNLPSPILYCTPDSVNNKSFSISRGTKYCVIQEDTVEDTKETFEGEDSTSVNGMKKQISEHQIDRYSRSSRSDVDGNIQSLDMGSTLQTLSTDAPSQDKLEQNTEDSKGHHQLKDPDRKVNDFVSVKRHNQSIDAPSQESELDKTNVWELKLKKAWAFNTRKCVDASPLVVVR